MEPMGKGSFEGSVRGFTARFRPRLRFSLGLRVRGLEV